MRNRVNKSMMIAAGISLAGFAAPAMAYLDPGTGSMIVSAIIGIFATIGLALKTYWYKLKSLFSRKDDPADAARDAADPAAQDGRQES